MPKKRAGGNTVAGQLLDMPIEISQMIGKNVSLKKATMDFDSFISIMEENRDFSDEREYREDNIWNACNIEHESLEN